jgi:hypothetical protein
MLGTDRRPVAEQLGHFSSGSPLLLILRPVSMPDAELLVRDVRLPKPLKDRVRQIGVRFLCRRMVGREPACDGDYLLEMTNTKLSAAGRDGQPSRKPIGLTPVRNTQSSCNPHGAIDR